MGCFGARAVGPRAPCVAFPFLDALEVARLSVDEQQESPRL